MVIHFNSCITAFKTYGVDINVNKEEKSNSF